MLIFWYILNCMPYRYVQSLIWRLMLGGTKFGVKKSLFSTKHHTNDNYRYVTLKRTHCVPDCVYSLEAYALSSWLRVLPWSVRTMFLAARTALKRTHYVPDGVYCLKAYTLCSWLRLLPWSLHIMFPTACTALKLTHYVPGCVYRHQAYALCSWLRVPPLSVHSMVLAACTAFKRTLHDPGCVELR